MAHEFSRAEELRNDEGFRAFSIHMLPFEGRAGWLFLEEKATWLHCLC
jgi:hypothetical protein